MKNYSDITENLDITTKQYVDSGFMPKTGGTFTGDVTITPGHLKTDLIKSADNSKWIAEFTAAGLELGGSGYALRFYSNTRPIVANQNKELAYTSDIPDISGKQDIITESNKLSASLVSGLAQVATSGSYNDLSNKPTIPAAVTESTVSGWGFTKNKGTVTSVAVKMNGAEKGKVTSSGTIDLGTVLTDASKFATSAQGTKADTALQSETDPTVPPWAKTPSKPKYTASEVGALSLDGGTINKSKTVKMDASANSDGANLKWGTVNHKNPYIGYASDQVDGTFVVGSLLGTNYASGLAIGGGSGNLLWKGTKVATTSDITAHSNIVATQTTLGHIKMYVEGDTLYLNT